MTHSVCESVIYNKTLCYVMLCPTAKYNPRNLTNTFGTNVKRETVWLPVAWVSLHDMLRMTSAMFLILIVKILGCPPDGYRHRSH